MVKRERQLAGWLASRVKFICYFFAGWLSPHFIHISWAGPLGVAGNGPAIREEAAPAGASVACIINAVSLPDCGEAGTQLCGLGGWSLGVLECERGKCCAKCSLRAWAATLHFPLRLGTFLRSMPGKVLGEWRGELNRMGGKPDPRQERRVPRRETVPRAWAGPGLAERPSLQ